MAQDELPSALKNPLNPKQLSSLEKMFDKSDVNLYFQSLPTRNVGNQMISAYYSDKIVDGIEVLVNKGALEIGKRPKKVNDLLDDVVINEEQLKATQLKERKQRIDKQLEYLKNQTSISHANKQVTSEEGLDLILSKDEHKSLIKRIKREREDRSRKHGQVLNLMHEKSKQKQQLHRQLQEQRQKELLQQRREQIEKNLLKHKEQHENMIKIQRQSKQKMKSLKTHKFMYQQIEEKYQKQVVFQNLEDKKKKLKELREYKSFNIDELKQHERTYLEKKKLNESRQVDIKEDWKYQPPQRSERLALIIEEERLEKIKLLEDKKKQLDDKLSRQEDYIVYLRENFVPKVDPLKRQQLQKRLQKEKISKPEPADLRGLGIGYLQEAKRMRRKIDKSQPRPQTERNTSNPVNLTNMTIGSTHESKARAVTNYLSIDHNGQHYQKRRRKNLEKLMKSQVVPQYQKIKQLKLQSDKINVNMKRKQTQLKYKKDSKLKQDTLQLLLSSIQAKIGIIEMYN